MNLPFLLDVPALEQLLDGPDEFALFDVREEGVFAHGHLMLAGSLPLSRLELRAPVLMPRRGVRVVLCDAGEGLAQRAAAKLIALGYTDVGILDGGIAAWQKAGHHLFGGIYVPSKAFGEIVEHRYATPSVDAAQLHALLSDPGADVVVVDSRPFGEFQRMSIPGGLSCPGAELVFRLSEFASSPQTRIIVNCAGRTRSIIGAQSLINAGATNEVAALRNGTMGWELAGFDVARNATQRADAPTAAGRAEARRLASGVAKRFNVRTLAQHEFERFRADPDRTLYIFDVRTPEEYAQGHYQDAISAPGGQLVQATDSYVGVWNSRIVLYDDDGVRGTMTASWLVQRGFSDVYVMEPEVLRLHATASESQAGLAPIETDAIAPAALNTLLRQERVVLIDLSTSVEFADAHIPGAVFAIRSRFAERLPHLPHRERIILTSPDGRLAGWAAGEAAAAYGAPVSVLAGGTAQWEADGYPLEAGFDGSFDPPEDLWHTPSSRFGGGEPAMREYLSWEVELLAHIAREPGMCHIAIPALRDLDNGELFADNCA